MIDYFVHALIRQLPGLRLSVELTVVSSAFGLAIGFLGGVLLTHSSRWVRYPVIALVEIVRGFPALLVLYLVYDGLPKVSVSLGSTTAAIIAFSLTVAGFTAEIFRAAIVSVPAGQLEAAKSLALKPLTTIRLIVLPHVFRVAVPPLIGIIVIAFQGTSLAIAIGVTELTGTAFQYGQVNFTLLPEITVAAVLYLVVTSLLIWVEVYAERRAKRMSGGSYTGRRPKGAAKASVRATMG